MLKEFKTKKTTVSTEFVFYAGHTLQDRGENFSPFLVDADIKSQLDIQIQGIDSKQLIDILVDAKISTHIDLLGACKNDPFELRTRSLSRDWVSVSAPLGNLITHSKVLNLEIFSIDKTTQK